MRLAIMAVIFLGSGFGQAVITDSGSTNRQGMSVTMGAKGHAMIEARGGAKTKLSLQAELQKRFLADLEAAGPIDQIKARHCMKSVSFGSSMYVTYKGVRSPDLSCAGQTDATAAALQKEMQAIMDQARAKVPAAGRFR